MADAASPGPPAEVPASRGPLILRGAVTLAVFAAIFSFLPLADVWDAMSRTGWPRWGAVAVVFGLGHAVAAWKWRGLVQAANDDGKQVLVVTNLIGARTIQSKLRKDLQGLEYKFNAKGLVQHDGFVEWIGETVQLEVRKMAAAERS